MRNAKAEEVLNKRNRRVGEFLQGLTQGRGAGGLEAGTITRITIRLPSEEDPATLLVVKAREGEADKVGFVGGLDLIQALLVWAAKDAAGGLKWREDKPYGQR